MWGSATRPIEQPGQVFSPGPPLTQQPGPGGDGSAFNSGPPPSYTSGGSGFAPYQQHFPGLEPLIPVQHLFIKQEVSDMFFNSSNHYKVMTETGQQLYGIVEKTGALMRFLGGGNQRFNLIMKDMAGHDVLQFKGSPGFFSGAGVNVLYQGAPIGGAQSIRGSGDDCCKYVYNITDQSGAAVLQLKSSGGFCCFGAGGSAEFPLLTLDGRNIGRIGKEWGGFGREFFTSADTFGVNFPVDLHVAMKAVLLAATVMIDFQLFEQR